MSRKRTGLLALATLAAGVVAGAAIEELAFRRTFQKADLESGERLGAIRGERFTVTAFDSTILSGEAYGPEGAPPIVFLHGLSLTHDVWHYQIRDLRGEYRVIAYDARGHAASGLTHGTPLSTPVLARDLAGVLEALDVRDAVLVGHSMGGMTLLQLALQAPDVVDERVCGLVLLNTTFTSTMGAWKQGRRGAELVRRTVRPAADWFVANPRRLERLRVRANDISMFFSRAGFGTRPSPTHVEWAGKMLDATSSETLCASIALEDFDVHHVLEKIDVPVLVIGGEKDVLTPPWLTREMAERIPNARLVIFPGTGHMSMLERHEALSKRIGDFARRLQR